MKKILFGIIVLLSNFCSSQQIDNRLSDFFTDTSIRLKVVNAFDFIKNSTTIRLNDYQPVIISLDADDLRYERQKAGQ